MLISTLNSFASTAIHADHLPRHLNDGEYQQLLQTVLAETEDSPAGLLHRTWFLTLAFTGIRLSELLDLRLSDLDLATGRLFIHDPKNQDGRVAFLTPSLLQHLQHYLAWRPPTETDHLFVTAKQSFNVVAIRYRCRKWSAFLWSAALAPSSAPHIRNSSH